MKLEGNSIGGVSNQYPNYFGPEMGIELADLKPSALTFFPMEGLGQIGNLFFISSVLTYEEV